MNDKKSKLKNIDESTIQKACMINTGPLDNNFLCRSISVLNPLEPILLNESATILDASRLLKTHSIGCLIITNNKGEIAGVFSERDFMCKVFENTKIKLSDPITTVMTKEPFTVSSDSAIAYCLSLMSTGGFRHLPIVDQDNMPIGIVSVKDVINYLADNALNDLLSF